VCAKVECSVRWCVELEVEVGWLGYNSMQRDDLVRVLIHKYFFWTISAECLPPFFPMRLVTIAVLLRRYLPSPFCQLEITCLQGIQLYRLEYRRCQYSPKAEYR
jgi:hypothetical protein